MKWNEMEKSPALNKISPLRLSASVEMTKGMNGIKI